MPLTEISESAPIFWAWDEGRKQVRACCATWMELGFVGLYLDPSELREALLVLPADEYALSQPGLDSELKLAELIAKQEALLKEAADMRLILDKRINEQRGTLKGLQRAHDAWKAKCLQKQDDHDARIQSDARLVIAEKSLADEIAFRNVISQSMKETITQKEARIKSLEETNAATRAALDTALSMLETSGEYTSFRSRVQQVYYDLGG